MNLPPGLTCGRCTQPLYPHLARATDDALIHTDACVETCHSCQATLVSRKRWDKQTPEERADAIAAGRRRKGRENTCSRCAKSTYREDGQRRDNAERARAERIEDLEWMAETGESLAGAAHRLGLTLSALEHFLSRAGRLDLRAVLVGRNPHDHNAPQNRTAVVRAKREQQQMEAA